MVFCDTPYTVVDGIFGKLGRKGLLMKTVILIITESIKVGTDLDFIVGINVHAGDFIAERIM